MVSSNVILRVTDKVRGVSEIRLFFFGVQNVVKDNIIGKRTIGAIIDLKTN